MLHLAVQDVRNSLDTPVRMPGKTLQIIRWIVGMEVVKKQERVEQGNLMVAEGAFQVDTRPLDGRFALPHFADFSN